MTTTFETAKVGDRVWDYFRGWGVVGLLNHDSSYPLEVEFTDTKRAYDYSGVPDRRRPIRLLFWDEVVIEAPVKPLPDLEVDAKLLVWDNGRDRFSRHFSHFSKDGVLHTFSHGKTSFTGAGHTTPWDNWELAE